VTTTDSSSTACCASSTKLAALNGKVQSGGRLQIANALNSTDNRPFNDNFAERAQLSGNSIRVRSSNAGATRESGEPSHAGVTGGGSSGGLGPRPPDHGGIRHRGQQL